MTDRVQTLLTETAQGRLAALVPSPDPVARVNRAVDRSRRRRQGAVVVTAALSVVLSLVVVVTVVPRLTADPLPPGQRIPDVVRTVEQSGETWPVAGALVTELAFVNAVEDRVARIAASRTGGECQGSAELPQRLLFADDVLQRRIVVVRSETGCWWVGYGQAGARVDQIVVRDSIGDLDSSSALAVTIPGENHDLALLVIGADGSRADLVTQPPIWPSLEHTYEPMRLTRGFAFAVFGTQGSAPVNSAWLRVRTSTSSNPPTPTLVAVIPANGWSGSHDGQFDAAEDFVARLPAEGVNATRTAMAFAVANGRFKTGQGPVTVALVAGGPGLAVVDVVQDGIRSRALSSGRQDATNQVLLSDAGRPDPRPVLGWYHFGCAAWLPVGTTLDYHLTGGGGTVTATADGLGFVRNLPCFTSTVVLDVVTDASGMVLWQSDPRDTAVQPGGPHVARPAS